MPGGPGRCLQVERDDGVRAEVRAHLRELQELIGEQVALLPDPGGAKGLERIAIALGMLPAYWYFWKRRPENKMARTGTTLLLAFAVWFGFIAGHLVNNVRGLL